MSATPAKPLGADLGVWVVGVAWQAPAAVMAPFVPAGPTAPATARGLTPATVLGEAALRDAEATAPVVAPTVFVVGDASAAAGWQAAGGVAGGVTCYPTLAAAVLAALAALQASPFTACLIEALGPSGQSARACMVLETAASATARGAGAYAVIAIAQSGSADSATGGNRYVAKDALAGLAGGGGGETRPPGSLATALKAAIPGVEPAGRQESFAVGWLELPAGERNAREAAQIFAPSAAVLASALRSSSLARAEAPGVRDALALVRAVLALGHKVLPLMRPSESGLGALVSAPLPWIHPLPLPGRAAARGRRQAGWLAGDGQPAYLLLQEDPAAPARPDAVPFSQELCVFGADSPAALSAQVIALHQWLRGEPAGSAAPQPTRREGGGVTLDLASIAYQTIIRLPSQSAYRLAVVSGSVAELDRQLGEITTQLFPQTRAALHAAHRPSSGIYCGSGVRDAAAGTTAFLFPGLGASYPYMLADLCLHFPAVRAVFDSIDFVAAELGEGTPPSQQVFPWPGQAAAESVPSAAVITLLMAEWALAQLLRELGVAPDALMGCSTGEFAALCQGGSIDEVAALPIIYRLSLGVARGLPAALLATLQTMLVAAAAESLQPLFSAAPGALYVSADLGPDCALVVGERAAVSWLLTALEARGVAAQVLPGGVPYHTPLLNSSTVSGAAELSALTVQGPKLPIWSCATARPYPADPAAILGDASVLFVRAIALRDTVEAMYQSGVRTFVEVGPGEGLGRRVGAILRGRPHVALTSNLQQRSGVSQLMHLLAALHALGHPLALAPLFHRRLPPLPPTALSRTPEASGPAAVERPVERPDQAAQAPLPQTASRQPAALWRSGTALPALTLDLPRAQRWCCLRIDHWELGRAGGDDGIELAALFSAAELQQRTRGLPPGSPSLLADWAAKRAVQELIGRLDRRAVGLPEIELNTSPAGDRRAAGTWTTRLGGEPRIAVADCGDAAVALVAAADLEMRIGIQITKGNSLLPGDAQTAVCRALPPDQRLSPAALQVATVDPLTGWIGLRAPGQRTLLHARTVRLGAYFITIAVLPGA